MATVEVGRAASSDTNMRDVAVGASSAISSNNLFDGGLTNTIGVQWSVMEVTTGFLVTELATIAAAVKQIMAWGNTAPYNSQNANDGRSYFLYELELWDVTNADQTATMIKSDQQARQLRNLAGRWSGDCYDTILAHYA